MALRDVHDPAWHADPRTSRRYDRNSLNRYAALRLANLGDRRGAARRQPPVP
jgi:hypothetical protein